MAPQNEVDLVAHWSKVLDNEMNGDKFIPQYRLARLSCSKDKLWKAAEYELAVPQKAEDARQKLKNLLDTRNKRIGKLVANQFFRQREGKGTSFSRYEALQILIALDLADSGRYGVEGLKKVVDLHITRSKERDISNPLVAQSLERVERHLLSRLWEVVLLRVFGLSPIRSGTLSALVVQDKHAAETWPPHSLEAWATARLKPDNSLYIRRWIGTERQEMVFFQSGDPTGYLQNKEIRLQYVEDDEARYVLIVALPDEQEPTTRRSVAMEECSDDLARYLLKAMTSGVEALRKEMNNRISSGVNLFQQKGPSVLNRDVLIWLTTRFACHLAAPDDPDHACCYVYSPQHLSWDREGVYKCTASSELDSDRMLPDMPASRLLLGYAGSVGMTLAIDRSVQPLDDLVAYHDREQTRTGSDAPAHVAIPVPPVGYTPSSVLYVVFPNDGNDELFSLRVRALQILAPIMGELIDRCRATIHTLKHAADAARLPRLKAEEFKDALTDRIRRLVDLPVSSDADLRLAFVLLVPQIASSVSAVDDWVRGQWQYLIPDAFIAPWLAANPEYANMETPLWGELDRGLGAGLLLIPQWLEKHQLDRLRTALPLRLNNRKPLAYGDKGDVFRLNVWIIDVRKTRFTQENVAAVVHEVLRECQDSAAITDYAVSAYLKAYKSGNWQGALDQVKEGLRVRPHNAYLLRRSAEFNLRLGRFDRAAADAQKALASDETSVSARCLWGNALVAQGQLLAALHKYAEVYAPDFPVRMAPHPLPAYYMGQALLTTVRILRAWVNDRACQAVELGSPERLIPPHLDEVVVRLVASFELRRNPPSTQSVAIQTIRRLTQRLAEQAAELLSAAGGSLRNWGYSRLSEHHRNFAWTSCLFAQERAALFGSEEDAVDRLFEVIRNAQTKDDLLLQELTFAHLRRKDRGLPELLLKELAADGALDMVDNIVSSVVRRVGRGKASDAGPTER